MRRALSMMMVLACASSARAEEGLTEAALFEAGQRQQWAGIDEQIQLRRIDQEALSEVRKYRAGEGAPSPTRGDAGRVVFEFGSTVPTIFCTPLRMCDIELQAGEGFTQEPLLGDSEGWVVERATAGMTEHVVIKPKIPGISTNLAIYTDRRVYHLELLSTAKDAMPFVAFRYPEDRKKKWLAVAAQHGLTPAGEEGSKKRDEYEVSVRPDALHFGYTIERAGRLLVRRRIDWEPLRAFDDGEKTIIEMPRSVLTRELPVLFVREADGKDKLVNYRVKGTRFIVDRLFERAVLAKGVGMQQERVLITREKE